MAVDYETPRKKLPLKPGVVLRCTEGPHFICPNQNCKFEGRSVRENNRSNLVGFLLLLLAVVPGILYLVLCPEFRDRCPKCGVQVKL